MSQGHNPESLIPPQPMPASASPDQMFDLIAAGIYSLASMLVGEGEESVRLVESAVATTEVSEGENAAQARKNTRLALCKAALEILSDRDPASFAAPQELGPAGTCIDDEDLDAAGVSGQELEKMLAGSDRDRVRAWLASLSTAQRVIFAMRAVAGLSPFETAELLAQHGGPRAADWTRDSVRVVFRQALCSLASQLLHETTAR